ncbi:MAG: hypothetical protein HY852_17305 [Bradyrhizobium sp.]|uniref:hypothetical protein n=1 Tax=Bradyrhizobium sp. TaxID=376 RepID=UPI0025BA4C57|nr:hypothetical protein [Bradyrhizobium sp.]MBI5263568.1 hypothetical protein [Bradyrhizobium sp.]
MNFRQMSDGIQLHHPSHRGYDHDSQGPTWLNSPRYSASDTGHHGAGYGEAGSFASRIAVFEPHDAPAGRIAGHAHDGQSNAAPIDQHASEAAAAGHGGNGAAGGGGNLSVLGSGFDLGWLDSVLIHGAANEAGNGGSGYFYGGIIHASLLVYQPINITVAAGYGSSAQAHQTNNVSIDQSAFQMAGVGGNGGNGNAALGGNVEISSSGSGAITTGANSAGNGGSGYFSGTLIDAPVVIYKPVNIAVAGPGGTAHANQSNIVEIDQSAVQIAGVGGNGGNGNIAMGGNASAPASGSASGGIDSGGNHTANGGDGYFHGDLVHTSVVLYNPINIAVAGYNSSTYAFQNNNVHLDQYSFQMTGIGGNGGNSNAAAGGHASLVSGLWGGSDAIATGANSAGNGGNGYFSGSLVDFSIAIYAPINIAIAGPHSIAEADQINNVQFDQGAVQIAGLGGDGGNGNLALGGDLATHLLSDLHLIG